MPDNDPRHPYSAYSPVRTVRDTNPVSRNNTIVLNSEANVEKLLSSLGNMTIEDPATPASRNNTADSDTKGIQFYYGGVPIERSNISLAELEKVRSNINRMYVKPSTKELYLKKWREVALELGYTVSRNNTIVLDSKANVEKLRSSGNMTIEDPASPASRNNTARAIRDTRDALDSWHVSQSSISREEQIEYDVAVRQLKDVEQQIEELKSNPNKERLLFLSRKLQGVTNYLHREILSDKFDNFPIPDKLPELFERSGPLFDQLTIIYKELENPIENRKHLKTDVDDKIAWQFRKMGKVITAYRQRELTTEKNPHLENTPSKNINTSTIRNMENPKRRNKREELSEQNLSKKPTRTATNNEGKTFEKIVNRVTNNKGKKTENYLEREAVISM